MDLKNKNEISLDEVKVFFAWLQGTPYKNMSLSSQPRLSPEEAFSIIYVLQEELHLIPDTIEMCLKCKELFDTKTEGRYIDEDSLDYAGNTYDEADYGNYCDNCEPV